MRLFTLDADVNTGREGLAAAVAVCNSESARQVNPHYRRTPVQGLARPASGHPSCRAELRRASMLQPLLLMNSLLLVALSLVVNAEPAGHADVVVETTTRPVKTLAVTTSLGALMLAPLIEVDLRVIDHLSLYGSAEGNVLLKGYGLQFGGRGYWAAFDGAFIDAHVRFAEYQNWGLKNVKRTEVANPGVAVGFSHNFKSGLVLSGSAGANFMSTTSDPQYASCGSGGSGLSPLVILDVLSSIACLNRGPIGYSEPVLGIQPEARVNIGYAW